MEKTVLVTPHWVVDCVENKVIKPIGQYQPQLLYERLKQLQVELKM